MAAHLPGAQTERRGGAGRAGGLLGGKDLAGRLLQLHDQCPCQGACDSRGTTNVCWIVSCWNPITSGNRNPGRSCTSKISSTAVKNSRKAVTWPLRKSTTATPHFNCSLRSARGTPSIADPP